MRKLRARTGTLLVSMLSQDTTEDGKHMVDPETGLLLGREVHQPIGVVVASGVHHIPVGSKVVTICDLGEQYKWQGMRVQLVKVSEPCKCGRAVDTSRDLAAYKLPKGGAWHAAPGKVLVQIVEREQASAEIVAGQVADGVEVGSDCASQRFVYLERGAGIRWSEGCVTYAALSDANQCRCGRKATGQILAEAEVNEQEGQNKALQARQISEGSVRQKPVKRPKMAINEASTEHPRPALPVEKFSS